MEPDKKGSIDLESTRERQVDRAARLLLFKKLVARCRDDSDYFDRLFLLLLFTQIAARSTGGASAALGRQRIFARILNALSNRITARPTFLVQDSVNDPNLPPRLHLL